LRRADCTSVCDEGIGSRAARDDRPAPRRSSPAIRGPDEFQPCPARRPGMRVRARRDREQRRRAMGSATGRDGAPLRRCATEPAPSMPPNPRAMTDVDDDSDERGEGVRRIAP